MYSISEIKRKYFNDPHKNREWLYQKAVTEDVSFAQIAREVGYDEGTIGYWARKFNIKRTITWQDIDDLHGEEIERMYVEDNKSIEEIHQKFGYVFPTIKKILSHRNVNLRSKGESIKLGAVDRKKKYSVNDEYFRVWTSEMAYIVGFINSDGNIIYNEDNSEYVLQITIKVDDEDILLKIKNALEYEGSLGYYEVKRPNGNITSVARLAINSKPLVKSLLDIGILERKSLVKGIPDSLPKKYIFDYLRGYFDGNGTVDMRYERTIVPSLRLRLASGSEKHLIEVQDTLQKFGFSRKKLEKAKDANTFVLRFGNKETHFLYEKFYEHEDSIFMLRKKEKFDHCVQQRVKDQEDKKKHHRRERGKIQGVVKYA